MRYYYSIFLFLFSVGVAFAQTQDSLSLEEQQRREKNIQAGNPFEQFGYKPKISTLSKGKYLEFHDLDSIVQIGSFTFHIKKKVITGYLIKESKYSEATLRPEIVSRWFSPDPLSDEFPSWSPYNFTYNNPIFFIDPTGLAPETIFRNLATNEEIEVEDGIHKTLEVNDSDFQKAKFFANQINKKTEADGSTSMSFVSRELADAYTEFYNSNNSYSELSMANVLDAVFVRPKIKINEPEGAAGGLEFLSMGASSFILKNLGKGFGKDSSKFLKFAGDEANEHFAKHGGSIMSSLGKKGYNLKNYIDDANHIVNQGTFVSELNGYVKLIGGGGSAKYGFVGMNKSTGHITTFHIKTAKELSRKAPSLGIKY